MELFELPPGGRVAICGQSGSGKSTLARRYLAASPYHWVILNPKWSRAFSTLRQDNGAAVRPLYRIDRDKTIRSLRKNRFTILNFDRNWDHEAMDWLIVELTDRFENIGICVDELYTIHKNAQAGPGINGLITRGRELRQSFLGCTQRPAWVSKFVFSEADVVVEFRLALRQDRKFIYENTGSPEAMVQREGHDFAYFDVAQGKTTIYSAD